MSTLVLTVRESIRYRGRSGHISWIAHRISGLAILFFLIVHVWETANAFFWPELYAWSLAVFKYPPIAIGEIPLVGAVFYHSFNGLRISLLDFKPEWWKYQQKSALLVWIIFAIVFVPIAGYMLYGMVSHCSELGAACWEFPPLIDYGIGN